MATQDNHEKDSPTRAGKSIIICATQRTGSNMVFQDIRDVVGYRHGKPEILTDRIVHQRTKSPWSEVWEEVSARNWVEGYFVDKVMFNNTAKIARFIERNSSEEVESCREFRPELFHAFYNFFAEAIWVYLERRDVFAQAVSLHIANTTGIWFESAGQKACLPTPVVEYDGETLKRKLGRILDEREQWQAFFRHYNIAPIRITYEEAAAGYPHYLRELLAKAGLQMVEAPRPRRLLKQGGELNERFAERLRKDVQLCPEQFPHLPTT
jgi:LPS sulfotransferase NodH